MRLGTIGIDGGSTPAYVDDRGWYRVSQLPGRGGALDVLDLVRKPLADAEIDALRRLAPLPLPSMWLAPIQHPPKNIICVGRNYADHVREGAVAAGRTVEMPPVPVFFTKPHTALIGSGAAVRVPRGLTAALDYEGELAVVIGLGGRGIDAATALDHVFGYTVLNDITARDMQKAHGQWFLGKALDNLAPCGPVVVTRDEIADPQQLQLKTTVNGEVRQQDSTANMVFSIAHLIATLSAAITLEPGDIIATGTPAGTGLGGDPPVYLSDGDVVTISIQGVGDLTNTIAFV